MAITVTAHTVPAYKQISCCLGILVLLLCFQGTASASVPTGSEVQFTLTDGSIIVGRVYTQTSAFYYVTNEYGVFPVARSRVSGLRITAPPIEKTEPSEPEKKPERTYAVSLLASWGIIAGEFSDYIRQELPGISLSGSFRQGSLEPFLGFSFAGYEGRINSSERLRAYALFSGVNWHFLQFSRFEVHIAASLGGTFFIADLPDENINASGMRIDGSAGLGFDLNLGGGFFVRLGASTAIAVENSLLFVSIPFRAGLHYAF